MTQKEFIGYLVEKSGIKRADLIEKDLILQRLAQELVGNDFFEENFVFKGGTCLTKCYFGYYRFSEDLDFTWKEQSLWANKSGKQIRKTISLKIARLLDVLDEICVKLGLGFKPDKKDKKYMEFGAGNIFTTFKLWYTSCVSNSGQFVKIQINFVEKISYGLKKRVLNNLIGDIDLKELSFLFPEYKDAFVLKTAITSYDFHEILSEKARAILTRRGTKIRDFLDIYFIAKYSRENVKDYEGIIIEKTLFALKYEKYLKNMLAKQGQFKPLMLEEKEDILLKPVEDDWGSFIKDFCGFLNQMLEKIKTEIEKE